MIFALVLLAGAIPASAQDSTGAKVVVASKPFGESYLLSEMFAQVLEDAGYRVVRKPGLGATEIAFQALRTGAIDVYPEYTGTGLTAILHEKPSGGAQQTFRRVSDAFRDRWGIGWLPPLGFENTYAIAVRSATADSLNLRTLSDLAREASGLTAGFTPDFIGRPDGLPGLRREYDLDLEQVHSLLQSVKYKALASGEVDVIDGYSTDGLIARYDLTVLEDDRDFFPPYQAAALVGRRLMEEEPRAVVALTRLSGRISDSLMREWNERVEAENDDVALVAADALAEIGLGGDRGPEVRGEIRTARDSFLQYMWNERDHLFQLTLRHLVLVSISLTAAIAVAVPLGLVLTRVIPAAEPTVRAIGLLQTIPSIALLAFMIPLLGIGVVPALVALFLYSLYPILRNTYSGLRNAGRVVVGPAAALGMTPDQVLRYVRLPLAAPVIMAGIRTAAVINVGTATLAAFIGAGGLGDPIVAGLALSDSRMILSGAIPAALLALLVDGFLAGVEWAVRPRGL